MIDMPGRPEDEMADFLGLFAKTCGAVCGHGAIIRSRPALATPPHDVSTLAPSRYANVKLLPRLATFGRQRMSGMMMRLFTRASVLVMTLSVCACAQNKDDINYLIRDPADAFGVGLREIELQGQEHLRMDGLGPGLEIEMVVGRWGDIGASIFMSGQAYKILGDRSVTISDSQTFGQTVANWVRPVETQSFVGETYKQLTTPGDTYNAEWEWEADPWIMRLQVGVRIQFLGLSNMNLSSIGL